MVTPERAVAQWTLDVTVWHGPRIGHSITAKVLSRRGGWVDVGTWQWTGFGVPPDLVADCCARIDSVIAEHLVNRYGVAERLPFPRGEDGGIA